MKNSNKLVKKFGLKSKITNKDKPLITQIIQLTRKSRSHSRHSSKKHSNSSLTQQSLLTPIQSKKDPLSFNLKDQRFQMMAQPEKRIHLDSSGDTRKNVMNPNSTANLMTYQISSTRIQKKRNLILPKRKFIKKKTEEEENQIVAQIHQLAEMVDEMNENKNNESQQKTQGDIKSTLDLLYQENMSNEEQKSDEDQKSDSHEAKLQKMNNFIQSEEEKKDDMSFDSKSIFSEEAIKYFDDLMTDIDVNQNMKMESQKEKEKELQSQQQVFASKEIESILMPNNIYELPQNSETNLSLQRIKQEEFNEFSLNEEGNEEEKIWEDDFDFDIKIE